MSKLPDIDKKAAAAFRREIRAFYRRHGRALPFRETDDDYAITVSEIMLQQTQVGRVLPRYNAWLRRFPDWEALAEAPSREVLALWSGLGYNRRALYLREMARVVIEQYGGRLPDEPAELKKLPGIGEYTANAIAVFAFGKRVAAVDTNVRKVIIHKLKLPKDTPMAEIRDLAEQLLPRSDIREWHYALMDYARLGLSATESRAIPALSKQSKFEGSRRQIRGEIIRQLTEKRRVRLETVAEVLDRDLAAVREAAEMLATEGLITLGKMTARLK